MNLADHADDLPRYRDWAPTAGDTRGLALPDRQDWIVCPCGQNRDSEPLDESNFAAAQRILTDAGAEHEVHRFGHWACGWFEIIIVHPSAAEHVAGIACRLADYPVLDENDFGERECQAESEAWESYGREEYTRAIGKDFELSSNTVEWLLYDGRAYDGLLELYGQHSPELESFGLAPDITRGELASLIRQWRKVPA